MGVEVPALGPAAPAVSAPGASTDGKSKQAVVVVAWAAFRNCTRATPPRGKQGNRSIGRGECCRQHQRWDRRAWSRGRSEASQSCGCHSIVVASWVTGPRPSPRWPSCSLSSRVAEPRPSPRWPSCRAWAVAEVAELLAVIASCRGDGSTAHRTRHKQSPLRPPEGRLPGDARGRRRWPVSTRRGSRPRSPRPRGWPRTRHASGAVRAERPGDHTLVAGLAAQEGSAPHTPPLHSVDPCTVLQAPGTRPALRARRAASVTHKRLDAATSPAGHPAGGTRPPPRRWSRPSAAPRGPSAPAWWQRPAAGVTQSRPAWPRLQAQATWRGQKPEAR